MGVFQCPIHGHQGFEEVCGHIYDEFQNKVVPEMKELPILGTKVCNNCFKKHQVERFGDITIDSLSVLSEEKQMAIEIDLIAIYDDLNRKGECTECLNKLYLIDARKKGKQIPFKPYENTLIYKDNEIIERLRSFLSSNFEFQKFKDKSLSSLEAFIIISGGISYPLSIRFYYIIEKEEQEKILDLMDTFFEDIPQKQRKVSFYESEDWIQEYRGYSENAKRKQKLLSEYLIE